MPLLSQEDNIKGYWEEVKDQYPNLSFEQFAKICKSPFLHTKEEIRGSKYPVIFIKHLGTFKVYPKTLKDLLWSLGNFWNKKTVTEVDYNDRLAFLTNLKKQVDEREKLISRKKYKKPEEDESDNEACNDGTDRESEAD